MNYTKIVYLQYGEPEVMHLTQSPLPTPKENEILVKVYAAGVNPVDYKLRNGSMRFLVGKKFPKTPGGEIAGVVEQCGSQTGFFKPGDRVFAMLPLSGGGYSQYLCIPESLLSLMPENLSFNEAAGIPLAGLTALQALRDKGNLQKGMNVLVNGGSGGVGMFAIQIAKAYDAKVTAVCSGKNIDLVKSFGADNVIDYEKEDFTQSDEQFDIVFDAVAMSSPGKCKKILTSKGTFISTIPSPGIMLRQIINPLLSQKIFGIMCKPGGKDLDVLARMATEGKLKCHIERKYPLHMAPEAHYHIQSGRVKGKLVLETIEQQK
ncbi:MAG: NAD(P)-dependent alcohol dehydrogenase [Bacteroidales bacterium]